MTQETQIRSQQTPLLGDVVRRFGLPLVLLAVCLVFATVMPVFLSLDNMESMLRSASIAGFMFLGLTWVFAVGEIDVSFVAVAAIANMIIAGLVSGGTSWELACLIGFAAGILVGVANGFLVAYLKLPSLVTTIAVGGIAAALAASIGEGYSISIDKPDALSFVTTVTFGPIPLLAALCGATFFAAWYVQERLTLGQYIYAIAENREAVLEAGIPVRQIVLLLFVFSAVCSSLAGVLLTIELSSGQPSIAGSFFLDGLTAVLLGGTMLKLGKPNVVGTLFSVLILTALVRGGALLGWPDSFFQIMKGGLLVVGVAIITMTHKDRA
ncbi:MAG: ABC transporter permease [Rhodospirillales bacterium]